MPGTYISTAFGRCVEPGHRVQPWSTAAALRSAPGFFDRLTHSNKASGKQNLNS